MNDEVKYLNTYKEVRERLFHKYKDKRIEYYEDAFIISMNTITKEITK